jgi:hypothetical protein
MPDRKPARAKVISFWQIRVWQGDYSFGGTSTIPFLGQLEAIDCGHTEDLQSRAAENDPKSDRAKRVDFKKKRAVVGTFSPVEYGACRYRHYPFFGPFLVKFDLFGPKSTLAEKGIHGYTVK